MNEDELYDKTIIVALEKLLIIKFRPTFLALTFYEDSGIVEIVMSSISFDYISISERVISVFSVIAKQLPEIFKDYLLVIQTFNGDELEQVLDGLFPEEHYE